MSLVQLRLGEFGEGWVNYDNGLLPEVGKIGRPLPKLFEGAKCITDMNTIDPEKWTYAVCEQGIGDQVLYASMLNEVCSLAPSLTVSLDAKLIPSAKGNSKSEVFYLKMKGDYYRYIAEFASGDKNKKAGDVEMN